VDNKISLGGPCFLEMFSSHYTSVCFFDSTTNFLCKGLDDPSAPRGYVRNHAKEREARRLAKEIAANLEKNGGANGMPETPYQDQEKAVGMQAMDVVLGVRANNANGQNDSRSIGVNGSNMAESPFVGARKQLQQRLDVLRGPDVHSFSSPTSSTHSPPPPRTPHQMQQPNFGSRQPGSPGSPCTDAGGGLFGATSYSAFFGGMAGGSGGHGSGGHGSETPAAHVKYPTTADGPNDEDASYGQLDSMFAGMAGVVGLRPAKGKEYAV